MFRALSSDVCVYQKIHCLLPLYLAVIPGFLCSSLGLSVYRHFLLSLLFLGWRSCSAVSAFLSWILPLNSSSRSGISPSTSGVPPHQRTSWSQTFCLPAWVSEIHCSGFSCTSYPFSRDHLLSSAYPSAVEAVMFQRKEFRLGRQLWLLHCRVVMRNEQKNYLKPKTSKCLAQSVAQSKHSSHVSFFLFQRAAPSPILSLSELVPSFGNYPDHSQCITL